MLLGWIIVSALVTALGLVMAERVKNQRHATLWQTITGLALASLVMGMLVFGALVQVMARDTDGRYAASPLKPWFDSLRSGRGPCCSDADGYAISDVDWTVTNGHYRVRIPREQNSSDMIWLEVPDDAVITEPNRAGATMVWPIWGYTGPSIRCFMPGSMT